MNERLSFAIECAGQGLKVFPIQENKKKPLEGSRGFYDATDDVTQIEKWWGNHPEYNIGIRTGEVSNLTAIDVDGKSGMDSVQTIAHLLPENNRVIKTPHGYHLYFDYSAEFTTGVGFLNGLDVRNNSGYVVAPASVVECDKQHCDRDHSNEYTLYRDVPRQRINVVPGVFKGGARTQVAGTDTRENIPQLLKGVGIGVRDQTLTSLVGKLFHMGLPEDLVRPILYTFADNCSPPLEHRVVDEKI